MIIRRLNFNLLAGEDRFSTPYVGSSTPATRLADEEQKDFFTTRTSIAPFDQHFTGSTGACLIPTCSQSDYFRLTPPAPA